jgi:dihydroxyacetone kinase
MTDGGPSTGLVAIVRAIATDLLDRKDELNRLDGVAGDGDLGLTMTAAANALLELAPSLEALPEADAIRRCGAEIARRAPSTGGTLIAFALMAAAKVGVAADVPPLERAAAYLDAAAASVALRGQVEPGDRTMLDALQPAADAISRAAKADPSDPEVLRAALAAAADAANDGAAATSSMAAKVGRAGWLAGRAAGHEDAGARLIALAVSAVAREVIAAR